MKSDTKSSHIGIIAGAAVAYQMEKSALILEARYEVGLHTIVQTVDDVTGTKPDVKTSDITIMAGLGLMFWRMMTAVHSCGRMWRWAPHAPVSLSRRLLQ